jgi:DNA-binding NarL/FixJ family response regulator
VNEPIRVLIVGDDALCQRMRGALESEAGMIDVGQTRNGGEAIDLIHEMRPETRPGVVLLDLDAPRASNLQTVGQMRGLFPHIEIIVLNDDSQEELVLEALREGARGHLLKDSASPEIVQAIRAVSRGEAIFSPDIAGSMLDEVTRKHKRKKNEP